MKRSQRLFALIFLSVLTVVANNSCRTVPNRNLSSKKDDSSILRLRDSILQAGLDGEALYTILGHIKPMSSVVAFNFPIGNRDSTKKLEGNILAGEKQFRELDTLHQIQQALNLIQIPDLKFVLVPYRSGYNSSRVLQVTVLRISAVDSVLHARKSFFGQYGFVPGADPAVLLTVNEYEKRYERLRGYGYLFGYPDYAVDFFVKAFQQSDSTGIHVERNFFQIPTYARETGNFVYAYPKDQLPSAIDSAIYKSAKHVLENYKALRGHYLNQDSTVRAYELMQDQTKALNKKKRND